VARVKQVEHTIGKCDPTSSILSPPLGFRQRRNLRRWISKLQSLLSAEGWK
jgi:hypothetical protein